LPERHTNRHIHTNAYEYFYEYAHAYQYAGQHTDTDWHTDSNEHASGCANRDVHSTATNDDEYAGSAYWHCGAAHRHG
jgi:hypothetical protein